MAPPLIQLPPIDGAPYSNMYCAECWASGKKTATHVVDHIRRRLDGGSDDDENLQGLCARHHDAKRAREANEVRQGNTKQ